MDWFSTALAAFVCGISTFFLIRYWLKWNRILTKLDRLPGPPALPVLGNTLQILVKREELMKLGEKLTAEYGPIFRVWSLVFALVLVTKAEYVGAILSSTEEIDKGMPYKLLEPWLGTGLLTGTGAKWSKHRKLLTPSFHFSILDTFLEKINEKSKILSNKLKKIPSGKEFDMYPYITLCTLDIICEAVMGIDMNTQAENQENKEYISGIYQVTEAVVDRLFKPWIHISWVFKYFSSDGRKFANGLKHLHYFSNKVVTDKRNRRKMTKEQTQKDTETGLGLKKKQASFLDLLLEVSEKGGNLTDEEVRMEVDTFMFEGHDTTTAALCWAVFLLGNHLEIQERVFEELDSIFQGEERDITLADINEMKYLERVIKETLRLYPSVPYFDRTLKNDFQIGEYTIPAGVDIRIGAYNLHRNPEHFEDPNTFNPDNFLPEKIKNRHPFSYIPFSAGPRNCIGQKFAMMELKSTLARIVLDFRFESVEKIGDIILMGDLILRPKSGVKVKLYTRSGKS